MATNPLVKKLDLSEEELNSQILQAMGEVPLDEMGEYYNQSVKDFEVDTILRGRIVNIVNQDVIVDVGYKSEGVIPLDQFDDPTKVQEGDEVEVLLEAVEDDSGMIALSKRKADRLRGWERVISTYQEGDTVVGRATRKIKGGLLVEIGVPVFLPASQISIRRTGDIAEYIGREMECKIIKIDESRMNIVVSRRRLLEERREAEKRDLLNDIEVGQIRKGIVKNITDFGAFVDLGGIDGLLHITDISYDRIGHPSEVLKIDQELEAKVLRVDKEKERISLGLKQKQESPWSSIETKYPVGSKVQGRVVNVLPYGAFVRLEAGVEGLVHVSEMSWTMHVNHPNQLVTPGDEVNVVVLEIKKEKQEISLGMKQTQVNPWTQVEAKYPVGTIVEGQIRNLTNYGAFVEIEEGIDGLLHVTDMSWTRKVVHPSEVVKKGDSVRAQVLQVDQDRKRIALGLKQLSEDPWTREIPDKYEAGTVTCGEVTKIANFGVFVRLEDDLEGLLHISELANRKVMTPEEVVKVGDDVVVKIIRVDPENRKIGLSLKDVPDEDREEILSEYLARKAERGESLASVEAPQTQETVVEETVVEDTGAAPATDDGTPAESRQELAPVESLADSASPPAGEEIVPAPAGDSEDGAVESPPAVAAEAAEGEEPEKSESGPA